MTLAISLFLVLTQAAFAAPMAKFDSFAKCQAITDQVAEDEASQTGSPIHPSELTPFDGNAKNFTAHRFAFENPGVGMMVAKTTNLGTNYYLYYDFTKDSAGKVTGLKVRDNETTYFHMTYKVDAVKNTCAINTVTTDNIDSIKFDMQECLAALKITHEHPALDHCGDFKPLNPAKPSTQREDYVGPKNGPTDLQRFNDCVHLLPDLQKHRDTCRGPEFLLKYAKDYFAAVQKAQVGRDASPIAGSVESTGTASHR